MFFKIKIFDSELLLDYNFVLCGFFSSHLVHSSRPRCGVSPGGIPRSTHPSIPATRAQAPPDALASLTLTEMIKLQSVNWLFEEIDFFFFPPH